MDTRNMYTTTSTDEVITAEMSVGICGAMTRGST